MAVTEANDALVPLLLLLTLQSERGVFGGYLGSSCRATLKLFLQRKQVSNAFLELFNLFFFNNAQQCEAALIQLSSVIM